MSTLAWVRFPMACVTIVARMSLTTQHFRLLAMGAAHVNFIRVPCSAELHNASVSFGVYVIRRTCLTIATTVPANTHLTLTLL